MNEFDIIEHYFKRGAKNPLIRQGSGDDAAVFSVPENTDIATSIDTMVAGVHFLPQNSAFDIGYKALAVSVSDMAAMGAKPFSSLVSLTLEENNSEWLSSFAEGLFSLAERFHIDLIGGDLTRGPLSVSTVLNGYIPKNSALYRHGASVGDLIYVTGTLGDARAALHCIKQQSKPDAFLLSRLYQPTPRVEEGMLLHGFASSAIDISDGLIGDLKKIMQASQVGAKIYADKIPLSSALKNIFSIEQARKFALISGDDYELCFTVPPDKVIGLEDLFQHRQSPIHHIGEIVSQKSLEILNEKGSKMEITHKGYEHF